MKKIELIQKKGVLAIQQLRKNKLEQGLPFMINSLSLPTGQCYLEYPNGLIQIVTISNSNNDFKVLSTMSYDEAINIRKQFHFL